MEVYKKLMNIQQSLKAPKSQRNTFGNYNYRSCEDILEAVKPLLAVEKAVLTITDELIQKDTRYYIQATANFYDAETGEYISNTALAREDENKKGMDLAQITGSVSSYARKYALNGLFCIDDNKDPDTLNKHGKDGKSADEDAKAYKEVPKERIDKLEYLLIELNYNIDDFLAECNIEKLSYITKTQYNNAVIKLNELKAKNQ